ncbi:MAG TPA: hypothetical protein VGL76_01555 [Gaiellaceae bacterium]|jgi:hypothetical protein
MLSVCCLSGGPPERLAHLLALLRPVADEIVVGVDTRVDTRFLGPVAELADVLRRYPYPGQPEHSRQWLHEQASGDWVFWIDDDEVPSRGLLEALAGPPRELTHCFVRRRWLWRDGYIDAWPWRPDWQLRLVRREAARFPGILHVPIHASGPRCFLEAPLYHLDLLVKERAQREEQVRRYAGVRPGLRIAGRAFNEAYFIPESREPRVVPVPGDDAQLVRAALTPPPLAPSNPPAIAVATSDEIDAVWAERRLPEGAYRGRLEVLFSDPLVAGEVAAFDVRVRNEGTETWLGGREAAPEVRLSYQGLPDALRTPLPHDLMPGGETVVPVSIRAPEEPGRYAIAVDLVHERHRWFGCGVALELEVTPRRRALVLVGQPPGDEAFDAQVDALLADLDPALEPFLVGAKPDWMRDRFGVDAFEEPPDWKADEVFVLPAGRRRDQARLRLRARRLRRRARG